MKTFLEFVQVRNEALFGLLGGSRGKPAKFSNGQPVPPDWTDEDYQSYLKHLKTMKVPGMDPHKHAANEVEAARQAANSVTARAAKAASQRTVGAPPPERRYTGDLRTGTMPGKDLTGHF